MKRILLISITMVLLCTPVQAWAVEATELASPILITEVQAGSAASASQEFIELYNRSPQAINLGADQWQLEIATSTATDWSKAKKVALSGTFYPGTYLLIASSYVAAGETQPYLAQYASASFTSGLTYQAGHVRLATPQASGVRETRDKIEWTTVTSSGNYAAQPIESGTPLALQDELAPGSSMKRRIDEAGLFMATGDTKHDFLLSACPSPSATNQASEAWQPTTSTDNPLFIATSLDTTDPTCTAQEAEQGSSTELESPTADPPSILVPSEATDASGSNQKSTSARNRGLKRPQLSEILPNPAKPQTDALDEFIELYNSNTVPFDLSGFQLVVGLSKTKLYTFPEGTLVPASSFKAYFSGDTNISLSNSAGQVQLLDPTGASISRSEPYESAKEGQAWVLAQGKWQWSITATPGAANVIKAPTSKASKRQATKTVNSTKTTARSTATDQTLSNTAPVAELQSKTSLHTGVLAAMGGFAILYGLYEYRRDVANKIHQLRLYRAARREARRAAARRRSSGAD